MGGARPSCVAPPAREMQVRPPHENKHIFEIFGGKFSGKFLEGREAVMEGVCLPYRPAHVSIRLRRHRLLCD